MPRGWSESSAPWFGQPGEKKGNTFKVTSRRRRGRRNRRVVRNAGATKAVKRLASLVIQPKQYVDTTVSTTFATTWAFQNVTAIAEGDEIGTRDGREITVTMINMRGGFTVGDSSTVANRYRIVVFKDNENRGTPPDPSDVFIGASPGVDALRNYSTQNLGRFTFLYDRYFVTDKFAATGEANRFFVWNKKVNYRVQYTGNLSSDEGKGATYFGICVDSVAGFTPQLTGFVRVWYIG